ncbi:YcjF family protein [Magnetovibrio blakemorei]|uniref:GTPase n=1 Tax=Magnetovibrio blakemorei TaxID=28181 RepID=A0A1E5QAT0_9PROT|nr:DUF697 domain-containing protein [Magnetovibrio blakemorei]OEJ69074.1 hypothetical protein BEN30_04615 [Magnetovibrio blakemorei]
MSTEAVAEAVEVQDSENKAEVAMDIVKRNMLWSAGAGILPIPLVEFVAITGVQVKLIKELSEHYDVPFRKDLAKSSVIALLGSLGSVTIGKVLATSSLRAIPVVGPLVAALSLPAISAGVSYAIGRVFISHYEMGGTLLDFDPSEVRDYFKSMFDEGVKKASNMGAAGGKGKAANA